MDRPGLRRGHSDQISDRDLNLDYQEIPVDLQEDDDNAAPDVASDDELAESAAAEDPLLVAIDDLEGRVVEGLDEFKLHPGVRSSSSPGSPTLHEELAQTLRPVLEIAAHVGPSVARAHAAYRVNGVEQTVDEVYRRINSDLILPVMLESAQSDVVPAKRAASLQFFHTLHKECRGAGSYLDATTAGMNAGPYGPGQSSSSSTLTAPSLANLPQMRPTLKRRAARTSTRRGELLRYWVEASASCTTPGAFTDVRADGAIASRAVLSASAAIRPALRHVSEKISSADDAGATRLYQPVMRMVAGVMRRLFAAGAVGGMEDDAGSKEVDAVRSACVKFVEVVVLCFSTREQPGPAGATSRRRGGTNTDDFSLEDLPSGHPMITREALEEIGEYSFTTLRGLTLIGGQVKIDPNLLPDMMSAQGFDVGGYGSTPSAQIVAIIKPAALAFLDVEASAAEHQNEGNDDDDDGKDKEAGFKVDRASLELDFSLSQKSYALTINAVSMLATNRPTYFRDSAYCLGWRAMDPPSSSDEGGANPTKGDEKESSVSSSALTKAAAMAIRSQLKASCLTLLRNTLSVTAGGWEVLHRALKASGMEIQADKALNVAKQQAALKKAGRAARNRAAIFYEWEAAADERSSKRQKQTGEELAKMRASRAARGLGGGIQLPPSMVDACELVLLNLKHLPEQRPAGAASAGVKKRPATLDYVVDAIMSNGASLSSDESRWYARDGGEAWTMELADDFVDGPEDGERAARFTLDSKTLKVAEGAVAQDKKGAEEVKVFDGERMAAASDAFSRLVLRSSSARSKHLADFGNQIAAKLAWTLKGVKPSADLKDAHDMAIESVSKLKRKDSDAEGTKEKVASLNQFADVYPLVPSCLALEMVSGGGGGGSSASGGNAGGGISRDAGESGGAPSVAGTSSSLANRILNEAYLESGSKEEKSDMYDQTLDIYLSSAVHACEIANDKPNDNQRKRVASVAASSLPHQLAIIPVMTPSALEITSSLCDIEEVTKKAADAAKKSSSQTLAASAATHAAKVAAEKRATQALLTLRDAAFQRSKPQIRRSAVDCAVGIAAGRLPASASVEDKALKLVMNVLYPKAADLADSVVASATEELERAANYAIENHDRIQKANEKAQAEKGNESDKNPLLPQSDEEKEAMEKVRKPVVLFMALCVRKPEIIKALISIGSREKADIFAKAVRTNMPKLARAAATKHGGAKVALQVSDMVDDESETALLLSFLDNLVQRTEKALPNQELIDACHKIQDQRVDEDGKKDARFIIPVVSGIRREDLTTKLPEFVAADDTVFKAALKRMSERLGRHALVFRDEPNREESSLRGMTLCEQMVYLHRLDFSAVGLPQKRYLDAIRICLDEDAVFTDRVIMAALDYISGTFLAGEEGLPLAYMRTIILTCSKHESLHSWICHVLLPRLIEGKVYNDRRQWEGWMRCAKMLENTGEGVSSLDAIEKLPEEQLKMYRAKYPAR